MTIYCGLSIDRDVIISNLKRLQGQTFRLLPCFEEGQEWVKPLQTLIIEVIGLAKIFPDQSDLLILTCKLSGMLDQNSTIDFPLFRRSIFECCSLISKIESYFDNQEEVIIL